MAGLFVGIAGVLAASRLSSAQPVGGMGLELEAIAAVVIGGTSLQGGKGSIVGTMIGALIVAVLTNGLRVTAVPQEWQSVVVGCVILVAVYIDMLRRKERSNDTIHAHSPRISGNSIAYTDRQSAAMRETGVASMNTRRAVTVAAIVAAGSAGCSDAKDDAAASSGDKKPYVALISKGFKHQFWQSVKAGAEQAGKDFNVTVTFEGAQEEGNVEQQIQLLQTVLDKHPDAVGFAAIDSQAAGPLMQQAKTEQDPRHRLRLRRRQRRAGFHGVDRQPRRRGGSRQAHGRPHRPRRQDRHGGARPDQRHRRAAPRRIQGLHGEERAEHQDRRHPVQRRPAQGHRPGQGDHRRQPGPQGPLRLQRGRGHRHRARRPGARHHRQTQDRRVRLRAKTRSTRSTAA